MDIRPIEAGDSPALSAFFERIPESDRTFLKEDVGDPRVLADWVQPDTGRTIAGGGEPRRRGPAGRGSRSPRTRHWAPAGAPGGSRSRRHGAGEARRRGDRG